MMNEDERAQLEGLYAVISALLEDRLFDHELRKLLANVAIDRHMVLHANVAPGAPVLVTPREIESFVACTNPFCRSVNKNMMEFKRPEFRTNQLVLNDMQLRYKLNFDSQTEPGVIRIWLSDLTKEPRRIITPEGTAVQ